MEVVRTFNSELSSLYETKPPVSKAKMTQVTKSAIKGLKYYKHIVQSVEKFIQKCRPEYKVPGLYVIDSIVRQSRHQFGPDKDVFGPRFSKNFVATFQNLFKCVDEDRSKIVRVLNLWQKNAVFPSVVIQPLLDMGNPSTHSEFPHVASDNATHNSKSKSADISAWKNWPQGSDESFEDNHQSSFAEVPTRNVEKSTKANSAADSVQSSQSSLPVKNDAEPPQEENTVKFNKKLLDFDYGDEDEEDETPTRNEEDQLENAPENNPLALSMAQNLLSNPELLRQLQQMQQTIQQNAAFQSELQQHNAGEPEVVRDRFSPDPPAEPVPVPPPTQPISSIPYPDTLPPNVMPPYPYEQSVSNIPAPQSQMNSRANEWMMDSVEMGYPPPQQQQSLTAVHENDIIQASQVDEDHRVLYSMPGEPPLPALPPQDLDERSLVLPMVDEQQDGKNNSRSRSDSRSRRSGRHRSRSRSPRRRRSRSRSRSRSRRKRSRSRERERERQREREREREKEHGRRKKGIPPIRKNFMTVCSTTLWLGHVPKTMSEAEINTLLGEYGNVLSIDMIPPRGCAYVAMDRRQDAFRALQKLKTEKMKGSSIKVAWAPGKGMKGKEYKEYWEMEGGVSYIPFEKLPNDVDTLDLLEEGGFIDEDSMPTHLRELRLQEKDKLEDMEISTIENTVSRHGSKDIPMTSAPIATSSMMPPSSMGMPMMGMPQMMQPPQYGMPMPGMMPNQPPMVVPLPVGVPPPNPMMMVQPPSQGVLAGTPLPVGTVPQMPHLSMQHPSIPALSSGLTNITTTPSKSDVSSSSSLQTSGGIPVSGDATPTEEDGTIISSPTTTNPSHTLATVMSNSPVSVAHMGAQFGTGMGHHGMVRPMLPVMPPVSSAGTPIPFPPPQVGFGFPPPPMRPAVPNQNMPGVIPMPNSPFQWLQKAANPAFGAFGDSDMRYPVHPNNAGAVRQPAPNLAQPSGGMDASALSNANQQQVSTQTTNMPLKDAVGSTAEKDNESRRDSGGSDAFADKNGNNIPQVDAFGRSKDLSNDLRRQKKDESRDQMAGGAFGEADKMPRFPGPPEFQQVPGGAMRMPWMHGPPGPRFPHAFNPNVPPFPPRGAVPRPMHQPMDMDFFRHQVPRMHMPGPLPPPPQQPPQRWKNDGYSQQRNQDRFQNRRDYRDNRMEDDDQGRGHRPREDWGGHRRERWEDSKGRRNDEREEPSRDRDRGMWSDDKTSSEHTYNENKGDERKDVREPAKDDKPVQPKPKQKSDSFGDLAADLFRLQRYGKGRVSIDVKMNIPKSKKDGATKEKNVKNECTKQDTSNKEETSKGNCSETPSTIDIGNKTVVECDSAQKADESQSMNVSAPSAVKDLPEDNQSSQNSNTNSDPSSVKIIEVKNSNEEGRKGRERDRKRSRWGRTLSQEREFQQQMGTEKKLLQDDVVVADLQLGAVPPLPESEIPSDIAMAPTSGGEFLKTDADSISLDCGVTAEQSACPDLPVDAVSAVPASSDLAQDSTDSVVEGEPMPLS